MIALQLSNQFPKVFEIPFNSATKWHLSIHKKPHDDGTHTLYIKGAPERVFRLCSFILNNQAKAKYSFSVLIFQVEAMTDAHQKEFQKAYELMASKGHRVIGCAKLLLNDKDYPDGFVFKKELDKKSESAPSGRKEGLYPQNGYTFMGLISLEDPPKHGVREAIGQCRQAGVKVMMVTGDHPLTAEVSHINLN
jgi:sodium/potassium-transporting ATPase subunit alpha